MTALSTKIYKAEILNIEKEKDGYRLFYKLGNSKGVYRGNVDLTNEEKELIMD